MFVVRSDDDVKSIVKLEVEKAKSGASTHRRELHGESAEVYASFDNNSWYLLNSSIVHCK